MSLLTRIPNLNRDTDWSETIRGLQPCVQENSRILPIITPQKNLQLMIHSNPVIRRCTGRAGVRRQTIHK